MGWDGMGLESSIAGLCEEKKQFEVNHQLDHLDISKVCTI